MAEQPPIPFPQQNPVERLLANLTTALRSHTNALLEVKASLAVIAERLDRIVDAERAEADDIREIRRAVIDTEQKVSDARHNIREARAELKEITGEVPLPSPEELQRLEDARKPGVVEAVSVLVDRARKLPGWMHWFTSTAVGGAIMHALHKYLHW